MARHALGFIALLSCITSGTVLVLLLGVVLTRPLRRRLRACLAGTVQTDRRNPAVDVGATPTPRSSPTALPRVPAVPLGQIAVAALFVLGMVALRVVIDMARARGLPV
jgi:hypothetical protein